LESILADSGFPDHAVFFYAVPGDYMIDFIRDEVSMVEERFKEGGSNTIAYSPEDKLNFLPHIYAKTSPHDIDEKEAALAGMDVIEEYERSL
jgi:hypothetical protein